MEIVVPVGLALLIAFVVLGIRRLVADSTVVDSHPDEALPLIRDARGRAVGLTREHGVDPPAGPPGFEAGLEAMAKDLDADDDPPSTPPSRGA